MWTRQELKAKGKAAFKRNYWKSVAAGLVVLLTTGVTVSSGAGSTGYTEFEVDLDAGLAQSGISPAVFVGVLFGVLGVACLLSMAINAFLRNPIQVGTNRFFLKNAQEPAKLDVLLVVPGVIKSLEYLMVGYILADEPEIGVMEALRKSKQMMQGHKWEAFVLSLSFLGWEILGVVTFGIAEIFYVRPYVEATFAELYLALKQ